MSNDTSPSSRSSSAVSQQLPFALRVASAWAWRLMIIAIAAATLYWALAKVSLIIISVMIAALLAGLVSPVVYFLRRYRVSNGLATAITEIGLIALVIGLLAMVGQQLTVGFSSLSDQVIEGWNQLLALLYNLPIDLGADKVNEYISQLLATLQNNTSSILSGVASVSSTAADIGTGMVIVLFTLIFFLLEGEKIWLFIVKLFPREARRAVNGAGRQGWRSLVSYVRVQVFVAAVDAVGIGLSAFFLGVPLAVPLGVLVFLGSFIPVIGALLTGAIAVLLALVANGPVNALVMLLMVLLVQQIESNILQPLVMGKAVSLHPLAVVIAVLAGSMLYGVIGALFAVPILAVTNTVIRYLAGREWEKDPYIRESEFLYPHEQKRLERKVIAEKVKERLNRIKEKEGEFKAEEAATARADTGPMNHQEATK
ncbi:AI-2E family transporter [Rothia sp. CCM 9417]|uniref:AI-2E family transporter n=1 Tax=unclassified Rothia (in: high G+C Gram-positive bacteria) TaxID=2689056 RepID=UPI003ACFE7EA